jgi:hypothetical protein
MRRTLVLEVRPTLGNRSLKRRLLTYVEDLILGCDTLEEEGIEAGEGYQREWIMMLNCL